MKWLLLLAPLLASAPSFAQDSESPTPYLRLVEDKDGLRLDVAVRHFLFEREDRPDTVVSLVGVMHIADETYYHALQDQLDGYDVVLFEQVVEEDAAAHLTGVSPAQRAQVAATRRRMELLLGAAQRYRSDTGRPPASVEALIRAASEERVEAKLGRAARDAWGGPITFALAGLDDSEVRAESLGADGERGGEGLDADLTLREEEAPPIEAKGLQKDLADALGLVFQLEGIDYTAAHWRRCDVTLAELRTLLVERGASADGLLSALKGGSVLESLASGLLRLIGSTKSGRGMLKLVGVEALARADELLARPPAGFEALFEVLLTRRNDVVLGNLGRLLEDEPGLERVAVFYGAGHMSDLGDRLTRELGLSAQETSWLPAVELRFEDTGLPRSQIAFLRRTIGKALDDQLAASRAVEDDER